MTAPQISTAIIAGSLLAFALSFDEVIVTTFTIGGQETLPIWILANLSRPNQLPIVNVVAVFVILLSIIPVWIAHRLASGVGGGGRILDVVPERGCSALRPAPVAEGAVWSSEVVALEEER